jgi:hypothetical protein
MRYLKSKRFIFLALLGFFLISIGVDGARHLYFGMRYASTVLPLKDFYLTRGYKAANSVFSTRKKGLPVVRLYLSEQSQSQLLESPPISTKKWKQGYVSFEDKVLHRSKIRHRGDAPRNYSYAKKSWKVKLKKKDLLDRQRVFNFVLPRGDILRDVVSYWVAEEIGLATPKVDLVELFLNDRPQGVMMMVEQLDENYLRNSGSMPINLYKGEPISTKTFIGPFVGDLFNSPHVWTKAATNNSMPENDQRDLSQFLHQLSYAVTNTKDFESLRKLAPFDMWAHFAVFQELVQSWHNNKAANLRLIFDDWKGQIRPIAWDTKYQYSKGEPVLGQGSHQLLSLYFRQSEFVDQRNTMLYDLLNNRKPLTAVAARLEKLDAALEISLDRDAHYKAWSAAQFGIVGRAQRARQSRREVAGSLLELRRRLLSVFSANPVVSWYPEEDGVSLVVVGRTALSDVSISVVNEGQGNPPEALKIWWDADLDGIVGPRDKVLEWTKDGNDIRIDGRFLANRSLPPASSFSFRTLYGTLSGAFALKPTRFRLLFSLPLEVSKVTGANPLTATRIVVERQKRSASPPTVWNSPLQTRKEPQLQTWSGAVTVKETLTISDDIEILAGTTIALAPETSLVFRGKVLISGTADQPVRLLPLGEKPWGAFVLQGAGTKGSKISHLQLNNGSGGAVDNIRYTGMFSVHDTENISIDGLSMDTNSKYDDMLHVVYGKGISIRNITLKNAQSDAIDIDISTVKISDATIVSSGNDGIDFMDSTAILQRVNIKNSGDKGVSVGEGSHVIISDSLIARSKIGIESKDGSSVKLRQSDLSENDTQLNAYRKNWRYGSGGKIDVTHSILTGSRNIVSSKKRSEIVISHSSLWPSPKIGKRVTIAESVTFDKRRMATAPIPPITAARFENLSIERPTDVHQIGSNF